MVLREEGFVWFNPPVNAIGVDTVLCENGKPPLKGEVAAQPPEGVNGRELNTSNYAILSSRPKLNTQHYSLPTTH